MFSLDNFEKPLVLLMFSLEHFETPLVLLCFRWEMLKAVVLLCFRLKKLKNQWFLLPFEALTSPKDAKGGKMPNSKASQGFTWPKKLP